MTVENPKVIVRMGSHAEKDYIQKTAHLLDGVMIGANLLEATPAATASFLGMRLKGGYYVDPMTYVYGCDLEVIKSPQGKNRVLTYKRSYKKLSERLGGLFADTLERNSRISPKDLKGDSKAEEYCQSVVEYQVNRIKEEFEGDPEYKGYADDISGPAIIFSPYFYIEPNNSWVWVDVMLLVAKVTANINSNIPAHVIICTDESMLDNKDFLNKLKTSLPKTGIKGVWFWFSKFDEVNTSIEKLKGFRSLVEDISKEIEVYNLHGGYFSLSLCKKGLSGISHGVGYGEQRDIVPVIGEATPTVRYYLPDLHKRLGVPAIERCFDGLGIKTVDDFHNKICGCVVCKGVVSKDVGDFNSFGDMAYSSPSSKKKAQTPAAAKRCRFHFLMNRIQERDKMKRIDIGGILSEFEGVVEKWSGQVLVKNDVAHINKWRAALI
jgi:hypothetical protein